MAMGRRLHALLQMRSRAVAAAAAQASRSPHPARAAPAHRSPPQGFLRDAVAAARGRGQASRACAAARIRAIGAQVDAGSSAAVQGIRAIGAQVDARSTAAIDAFLAAQRQGGAAIDAVIDAFLAAQRQGGAAAAVAGKRLREALDAAIDAAIDKFLYRLDLLRHGEQVPLGDIADRWEALIHRLLLILYGQASPMLKTATRQEIREIILEVVYGVKMTRMLMFVVTTVACSELVKWLDDDEKAELYAMFGAPSYLTGAVLLFMIPNNTMSSAPEPICPILGICVMSLGENTLHDCLQAIGSLGATCGAFLLKYVGGVVLFALVDAAEVLQLTCETILDMIKGKTPEGGNYLDIEGLQHLTRWTLIKGKTPEEIADMIKGKSADEIAEMFKGKTLEEIRKTFNRKISLTREG